MRSLKAVFLGALLSLVLVSVAQASPADTSKAAQTLQQALGAGKFISSVEGPVALQALESATISKPELLSEMAALLAVARPELVAEIKKSITILAPLDADAVIAKMEQASLNPSIDQLAALAALEGATPAAGGDVTSSDDDDGADLGWSGYSRDGSPN